MLYFPYLNHFRLRPNHLLIFSLNTSSIETGNEHIQGGPLVELEITLPGLKLTRLIWNRDNKFKKKDAEDKKNEIPKEISSFFE